jgi:hypothetical protein
MQARIRQLKVGVVVLALAGSVSCGDVVRQGRSPMLLVIDKIAGASGATPGQLGVPVLSDVVTLVKRSVNGKDVEVPTIFNDVGMATMRMVLKDQGAPAVTATPTLINAITVTRYHVEFVRADGRNTPGVDVPYPFDGGVTATIVGGSSDVPFELVRDQAKEEAPLMQLASGGGRNIISTIAQITFYGKDLVGNDVQATGTISVNFGDFADPQ